MEIIRVTIRIRGIQVNTKTMCQLKQASVSVEKVICSCDEPAPLPAFGELREEETGGMEVAQCAGGQTWLCLN